ncbi:DNA mismatch repair protein MutS [Candidatus Woesearchaeota archaeon]|nr:DNA mismatch repair protein MutS [Candidatus Woesearchaeota archaeon]
MENLTPAMRQYMEIKSKHKECIVFFRMGDFYETFYDDAKTTSRVLDIALTKRGIRNSSNSIPLAGIPYHALDSYLSKMIKQGYKVAIVEQLEDPKLAKGVVKRDVVRIVTPGTVMEQNMLGNSNNFIASIMTGKKIGISFVDISTGEFFATEADTMEEAMAELFKYTPSEIIAPMSTETDIVMNRMLEDAGIYVTHASDVDFYAENAKNVLLKHFGVASVDGFGLKDKSYAVSSSGALLSYLYETQKNSLDYIKNVNYYSGKEFVLMDQTTIKNLELVRSLRDGSHKGTLFNVLDRTSTPSGSRLLKKFLLKPLVDSNKINERLLAVEELIDKHFLHQETIGVLKNISDIDRLISRINYGNSNPRDLVNLQASLSMVPELKKLLAEMDTLLLGKLAEMASMTHLVHLIDAAIKDEPPANTVDGNFIKPGFDSELDSLREISINAKKIIRGMEEEEREKTGIKSLKIRFNKVFGYYIDVTRPNIELVPQHYIKKQTLVNSERFITEELKELEEQILSAEEKIIFIEQRLFDEIVAKIKSETKKIQAIADNIAYLDVLCSFTTVSLNNNYTKPLMHNDFRLKLISSRHPVVERISDFIPNNVIMNDTNRMMIITGPNMAGKSVYMRQVALNVIMAQIGCFVPSQEAEIGVVDKIFCRTGASDDISQGQSTFMVEMSETAQILNSATENSLIILDEIGRGTSTYDGVSIAWAVAEYIAKNLKSKTLFATHYHVLNNMESRVQGIKNYNIAIKENEGNIIFLRKIIEGGTDKSYGIHVAKLAGMPPEVIDKSKEIQFRLEHEDEIAEKIIIETRKKKEKDVLTDEVEEIDRLIKTRQLRLDELG